MPIVKCLLAAPANPQQAYCTETFGSTKLAPVVAQGLSLPELREGCDQIMNILRLNFYQLDYAVTTDLDRRLLIVSGRRWGQERTVLSFACWSGCTLTLTLPLDATPEHA